MRFLITGITSFTSPHLANHLIYANKNYEICGTFRHSINTTKSDLSDTIDKSHLRNITFLYMNLNSKLTIDWIIQHYKFDGIFHIAAFAHPPTSFKDPIGAMITNTMGTVYLVESIAKYQPECVLHYCSTPEIYKPTSEIITEDSAIEPNNPYAVSKAAAELYVREQANEGKIRAFVTRAFSNTGPRRLPIYSLSSDAFQIAKILVGKQPNEIRIGNMSTERCVADVRDVVDVYYQLMIKAINGEIENGDVFNISGDTTRQMMDYLNIMLQIADIKPKLTVDKSLFRKVDIPKQIPDSTKVRNFLDWKPRYRIEETLRDLIDYWRNKIGS